MSAHSRIATRTLAVATALLLVSGTVNAQDRRRAESGRGWFSLGFISLDLAELNAALSSAGHPRFDDRFFTLGGGGFGDIGRWLIGGEGHALIGSDHATDDGAFKLSLGGGYGLFTVGYRLIAEEGFDLYPSIGLGGGGMELSIRGRSAPTFGDVLENPARSSRLATGAFLLSAGVGGDYRRRLSNPDDEYEGGLLIGAKVSYVFSPVTSDWKLDGFNDVAGGPELKIEGLHVRLTLGGWGRRPARD